MIRTILVFFRRKFRQLFQNQLKKKDIRLLGDKNFVIIANNCWGGEIYKWYNRPFNTPFIGLFIKSPCFIKFLSKFDHYISQELVFVKTSKYSSETLTYPVAKLDDIEIHFLHYQSEEEAREKWVRRTNRMLQEKNKDNYYFKMDDTNHCCENILKKFHQLPFKNKISFGVKKFPALLSTNHIIIKESHKNLGIEVPNGVKLYKLTFLYFDIAHWLKN